MEILEESIRQTLIATNRSDVIDTEKFIRISYKLVLEKYGSTGDMV